MDIPYIEITSKGVDIEQPDGSYVTIQPCPSDYEDCVNLKVIFTDKSGRVINTTTTKKDYFVKDKI